jgi:hypothetical protein
MISRGQNTKDDDDMPSLLESIMHLLNSILINNPNHTNINDNAVNDIMTG